MASPRKRNLAICLLLAVATLALYSPAFGHPFIFNYDDDLYVNNNAHVKAGLTWETVRWALTSTESSNWHPMTWLSHALDCTLYGLNPYGHHVTNVLLHVLNVVLLFLLLVRATGAAGRSFLVAALFAVHPFNVESVAWIAERKNVLSTFFFLLTLGAYGWYALKPDIKRYVAVAAMFVLALASKPMVVTLPCVLLLLDYWPLRRIQGWGQLGPETPLPVAKAPFSRLVLEKLPLLALSAADCAVTIFAQRSGGAMRLAASSRRAPGKRDLRLRDVCLESVLAGMAGGVLSSPRRHARGLETRIGRTVCALSHRVGVAGIAPASRTCSSAGYGFWARWFR